MPQFLVQKSHSARWKGTNDEKWVCSAVLVGFKWCGQGSACGDSPTISLYLDNSTSDQQKLSCAWLTLKGLSPALVTDLAPVPLTLSWLVKWNKILSRLLIFILKTGHSSSKGQATTSPSGQSWEGYCLLYTLVLSTLISWRRLKHCPPKNFRNLPLTNYLLTTRGGPKMWA